jgi:AcrR family transcriptional regulator
VARPRTITDERMLSAAVAVISRTGPGFTLADIAAEAGIAAGTLVARFGSKQGLLVAVMNSALDGLRRDFAAAVSGVDDPVAAVRGALLRWYGPLDDPATAANNLAQLATDLGDPLLRAMMADFYALMEAGLAPLIERAAGRLPAAPPPPVAARILTALVDGTALHWSARPAGSLVDRLRADLDAVLTAWKDSP